MGHAGPAMPLTAGPPPATMLGEGVQTGDAVTRAPDPWRRFTMNDIRFVECDLDLQRRVGEVMGDVAERYICLKDGFAFVAMDGDTPVGLIATCRRRLPDPMPETYEGFVSIIEVAASHRRRGIGRRLVEMSIDRCREQGLHQIRAWSSGDKAEAIPMWKALGFALCPATECPRGQEVKGCFVAYQL